MAVIRRTLFARPQTKVSGLESANPKGMETVPRLLRVRRIVR
jgi:hypothetical protein